MADVTGVFKSTVKMLKVRHKDVASIQTAMGDQQSKPAKKPNGIIGDNRDNKFSEKARGVVTNITNLRTFLIKNRKAYMAASSEIPLPGGIAKMSEEECDMIDADAMNYIKLCNDTLAAYRAEALHKHLSPQQREHRTLVLNMIAEYLKVVCQIYSEQRAIRVKRAVDKQRMSRLELSCPHVSRKDDKSSSPINSSINSDSASALTQSSAQSVQARPEEMFSEPVDEEITTEEAQLFKLENEQLYDEMNSTMEEVRHIEGKVVEISKLQDIFTEKVLEQDVDISRIGDTMVHSTENIVQGNDDIREAMKNNAGMRVWIIFAICVLSFTLLFLDWYND
ncbi:syntaxin-18-like [Watersipora subatra]|uniref:syntaxin-18-like n=1 Tax=Watersipora subatra TaxID=2589382 RepID=UPI00355B6786